MIIGIDPGKNGAATFLDDDAQVLDVLSFGNLTEHDIYSGIAEWTEDTQTFAFIEQVHSMPKQGVVSSFKFGVGYGFLLGLLTALKIPFERVTPQKWQKVLGCLSHGDKNITKAKAQELFPVQKWTHGTADSVLIAEYGRRIKK